MKRLLALLLCWIALAAPAAAQLSLGSPADKLLEPEKAFRFSARALGGDAVEVRFVIAPGYYLYRERLSFSAEGNPDVRLGKADLPRGAPHKDEFFGEVQTYRKDVAIRIPVQGSGAFDLKVMSQGCADAGVCYVPMESRAHLVVAAGAPALSEGRPPAAGEARASLFSSDVEIARLFEGNVGLVLASFLGFGLLLAFTPCVLPMIPILSSIIAGEGRQVNKARALALSAAYVFGMALAYAAAGIAAAYSGTFLAGLLQNAWVLAFFALVFVALAFSMFGFYDLQLPDFLHHRLHSAHRRIEGGRLVSVALMGLVSAVIVSPCVAAPLAGALLYISQTRDIALGGSALFAMALGMGLPLMAVGVSEGALLPKSGPWMDDVRKFFGVLLLAVALWIATPLLPAMVQMLAWSALAIGCGVFLRALDALPAGVSGWWRLWKAAGVMLLLAGVGLLAGALAGSRDPLRPLAGLFASSAAMPPTAFTRVASGAELETRLRDSAKPAMLDFYADWCVSCKEMAAFTFSDPRVRAKLAEMTLLQADVTANTAEHRALLKRFSLFGPPGIIFFDASGREIPGLRVIGYQNAERFLKTLERAAPAT
ncbi:MAG TPA: protein-disulfide reductase DsbD [Burkholderiales bacterium]|nr:protein-disulfide reductase DsbD [Burkholderiales bacterium]